MCKSLAHTCPRIPPGGSGVRLTPRVSPSLPSSSMVVRVNALEDVQRALDVQPRPERDHRLATDRRRPSQISRVRCQVTVANLKPVFRHVNDHRPGRVIAISHPQSKHARQKPSGHFLLLSAPFNYTLPKLLPSTPQQYRAWHHVVQRQHPNFSSDNVTRESGSHAKLIHRMSRRRTQRCRPRHDEPPLDRRLTGRIPRATTPSAHRNERFVASGTGGLALISLTGIIVPHPSHRAVIQQKFYKLYADRAIAVTMLQRGLSQYFQPSYRAHEVLPWPPGITKKRYLLVTSYVLPNLPVRRLSKTI
jgi:hypothetical protein